MASAEDFCAPRRVVGGWGKQTNCAHTKTSGPHAKQLLADGTAGKELEVKDNERDDAKNVEHFGQQRARRLFLLMRVRAHALNKNHQESIITRLLTTTPHHVAVKHDVLPRPPKGHVRGREHRQHRHYDTVRAQRHCKIFLDYLVFFIIIQHEQKGTDVLIND